MKLREIIEDLEINNSLCGVLELHIEYLIKNNRIDEAQEHAKELVDLKSSIHDMEESELIYK